MQKAKLIKSIKTLPWTLSLLLLILNVEASENIIHVYLLLLQVIKVKDDDTKFEVTLDVSEYRPEELKVTTVNNTLAIEGKHENQKSDEKNTANSTASGSSHVMRQFSRKWTLPSECNPNEVASNLSSDGILMITAPKKALTSQVPVQKALN